MSSKVKMEYCPKCSHCNNNSKINPSDLRLQINTKTFFCSHCKHCATKQKIVKIEKTKKSSPATSPVIKDESDNGSDTEDEEKGSSKSKNVTDSKDKSSDIEDEVLKRSPSPHDQFREDRGDTHRKRTRSSSPRRHNDDSYYARKPKYYGSSYGPPPRHVRPPPPPHYFGYDERRNSFGPNYGPGSFTRRSPPRNGDINVVRNFVTKCGCFGCSQLRFYHQEI